MFGFVKEIFIGQLTGLVNASNRTKCLYLTNQEYTTQPTIFNLHPYEFVSEAVILIMTYLIKYVFQTKQKIFECSI